MSLALCVVMTKRNQGRLGVRGWGIAAAMIWNGALVVGCSPTAVDDEPACYSPTQNTAHAYDDGAKGCACDADEEADVCIDGVALICSDGAWQAVEDGPCQPAAPDVACGARAGNSCSESQYCAYEPGQLCGAADDEATCKSRPESCVESSAPVCGCDQKTYDNACLANAAGTGILSLGPCDASPTDDPNCYSPTQNREHAYDVGAKGCACDADEEADVCIDGLGFICSRGAWQADEDGPCLPAAPDVACGARAGDSCSESQYCAYEPGQLCGGADDEATCKSRPESCVESSAPVCGCDQKTYDNACLANAAGTGILSLGPCDATCYSPTQNTAHAYDDGAKGCPCDPAKDESVCLEDAGLVCDRDTWVAVIDGPCYVDDPNDPND